MKNLDEVIEKFRQEGYKITPQRRAIFQFLIGNNSHPNAEEIYKKIKEKMPEISKTTVYNTLKELNNLKIIDIVHNAGKDTSRYDPKTEDHHHLYCLQCHCIRDLDIEFNGIDLSVEKNMGFQIIKKQITFFGYCPNCQKNYWKND